MAIPVAAGMIFQTLYLLVDLYFVAALGDDSVAGVGTAGTLLFMIMALTQVLGVSAVALISQAVGRKDQEHANLIFQSISGSLCAMCRDHSLRGLSLCRILSAQYHRRRGSPQRRPDISVLVLAGHGPSVRDDGDGLLSASYRHRESPP